VSDERPETRPVEPDPPAPMPGPSPVGAVPVAAGDVPAAAPPSRSRADRGWLALVIASGAVILAALGWWRTSAGLGDLRVRHQALADEVAGLRRTPVMDLTGAPVRGSSNAVVTLIEFSDYECPFCLRHFQQTMPEIERTYISTGKVLYAFRDWPVDELHPQAIGAHVAAHCAGEQNKYWEMHARLFSPAGTHTPERLRALAQELGLDLGAFDQCGASDRPTNAIRATSRQAVEFGASGTPVFFIGLRDRATNRVTILRGMAGAQEYAAFAEALDAVLAQVR
jgi:protein-disulfide isomerase